MAAVALTSYAVYLGLAFGLRTAMQLRRSGDSGFRGIGGAVGSPEWIAGVLFALAVIVGVAAPILALVGVVEPIEALDRPLAHGAGICLFVFGSPRPSALRSRWEARGASGWTRPRALRS